MAETGHWFTRNTGYVLPSACRILCYSAVMYDNLSVKQAFSFSYCVIFRKWSHFTQSFELLADSVPWIPFYLRTLGILIMRILCSAKWSNIAKPSGGESKRLPLKDTKYQNLTLFWASINQRFLSYPVFLRLTLILFFQTALLTKEILLFRLHTTRVKATHSLSHIFLCEQQETSAGIYNFG